MNITRRRATALCATALVGPAVAMQMPKKPEKLESGQIWRGKVEGKVATGVIEKWPWEQGEFWFRVYDDETQLLWADLVHLTRDFEYIGNINTIGGEGR